MADASNHTDAPFPGVPLATPLYREVKRVLMEALSGSKTCGAALYF